MKQFGSSALLLLHREIFGGQVHVFSSNSGGCAAFLSNYHTNSDARVTFRGKHYDLPPWSISILPNCVDVVFNTAKVSREAVA